jgi:hypothetical protein
MLREKDYMLETLFLHVLSVKFITFCKNNFEEISFFSSLSSITKNLSTTPNPKSFIYFFHRDVMLDNNKEVKREFLLILTPMTLENDVVFL